MFIHGSHITSEATSRRMGEDAHSPSPIRRRAEWAETPRLCTASGASVGRGRGDMPRGNWGCCLALHHDVVALLAAGQEPAAATAACGGGSERLCLGRREEGSPRPNGPRNVHHWWASAPWPVHCRASLTQKRPSPPLLPTSRRARSHRSDMDGVWLCDSKRGLWWRGCRRPALACVRVGGRATAHVHACVSVAHYRWPASSCPKPGPGHRNGQGAVGCVTVG